MSFWNFVSNKKGQGMTSVIIAAGLVVLSGLAVTTVITHYNKQSIRLENSNDCLQIAKQVYNSIEKDNNDLYITSFGATPGTTTWNQTADAKTDDGIPRFNFSGAATPVVIPPGGVTDMTYSSAGTNNVTNLQWTYTNYLNIKNAFSRLVALAGSGNYCCENLDPTNPNCGTVFYDDSTPRPSLDIPQRDVSIDVGVNITSGGVSRCVGSTLPVNNLPNAQNAMAKFMVRVYMNKGTANEKVCSAQGSVSPTTHFSVTAPLVNLEFSDSSVICNGSVNQPSVCSASKNVVINVQTFRDTDSTTKSCENNCLKAIGANYPASQNCSGMGAGPSIASSISNSVCATNNCTPTQPGSFFLCRIGEYNWFKNNPDFWEPCETAKVHDFNGSQIGNVSINYTMDNNSQRSTKATITLSGLLAPRAYMVDVRAVDSYGNLGPSFCSFSPSCSPASIAASKALPHFSMLSVGPTNGPISEITNMVMPANDGATINTTVSRTAAAGGGPNGRNSPAPLYSQALMAFNSANKYQCANGVATFRVNSSYGLPAGVYNSFGINFTATLTPPSGSATTTALQPCDASGDCTYTTSLLTAIGNYSVVIKTQNECGVAGTSDQTESWCLDNDITSTPTAKASPNDFSNPPTAGQWNSLLQSIPASKVCGTAALCPTGNQAFKSVYVASGAPAVCSPAPASIGSCLADPANNYCVQVMDPCGRSQNSNPTNYDTTLTCSAGATYCPVMNSCAGTVIGSSTSPSCAVNGECGSFHYRCIAGTASGQRYNSASKYFFWFCNGSGGGTNDSCSQAGLGGGTDGVCGATLGACTKGTSSGSSDPWTCSGSGGGADANCTLGSVNGKCATNPYDCLAGNSSNNSNSGNTYTWICQGLSGGTNDSCSQTVSKTDGKCDTNPYDCLAGTSSGGSNSGSNYTWSCLGLSGGSDASCSKAVTKINGKCGAADGGSYTSSSAVNGAGLCSPGNGNANPTSVSGAGPWTWDCEGVGGGTTASCSASKKSLPGGGIMCCNGGVGYVQTTSCMGGGYQAGTVVDCKTATAPYYGSGSCCVKNPSGLCTAADAISDCN